MARHCDECQHSTQGVPSYLTSFILLVSPDHQHHSLLTSVIRLLPTAVGAVASLHAMGIPHSLFCFLPYCAVLPKVAHLLLLVSWWHAT